MTFTPDELTVFAQLVDVLALNETKYTSAAFDAIRESGFVAAKIRIDSEEWTGEALSVGRDQRKFFFPRPQILYRASAPQLARGRFWTDTGDDLAGRGERFHAGVWRPYRATVSPAAVIARIELVVDGYRSVEFIVDPNEVSPEEISKIACLRQGTDVSMSADELMEGATAMRQSWDAASIAIKQMPEYFELYKEVRDSGVVPLVPMLADRTVPTIDGIAAVLAAKKLDLLVPVALLSDNWVLVDGVLRWGRYGAAGALLFDGDKVLMQLRADIVDAPGVWALPGGALQANESAEDGALRELAEEVGIDPSSVRVRFTAEADLDGWIYSTVAMQLVAPVELREPDGEAKAHEWFDLDAVGELSLHPDLAEAWPQLRDALMGVPA